MGFTATTTTDIPDLVRVFYSRDIEHRAQPTLRFNQFAVIKEELGKEAGETVTFTKLNNIKRGKKLGELENLPEQTMSSANYSLTVDEWGNAIVISQKLLFSAMTDTLAEAAILLGFDYAIVQDMMLRDAVHSTTNEVYANGVANINLVNTALTTSEVESATEILATNNAPLFNNEYYIGVISPRQYAQIKKDSSWVSAQQYAGSEAIFRGEVGMFDMVRFIQTTISLQGNAYEGVWDNINGVYTTDTDVGYDGFLDATNNGLLPAASNDGQDHTTQAILQDLHAGVIFGDNSYALAVGNPVELRDNGVENYGRRHGLAWIAIMNAGILENGDNAVRVISTYAN